MPTTANQNPEQIARDKIDAMLAASGWVVQDKDRINWGAGTGIAVREYQTDVGPADYVLFVNRKPVGIIEAKTAFTHTYSYGAERYRGDHLRKLHRAVVFDIGRPS